MISITFHNSVSRRCFCNFDEYNIFSWKLYICNIVEIFYFLTTIVTSQLLSWQISQISIFFILRYTTMYRCNRCNGTAANCKRKTLFHLKIVCSHSKTTRLTSILLYCRNDTANVTIYFSYFTCDIKSWFKKRRISVSIKWAQFQSNTHSFMRKMISFSKQELCVWSYCPC